MPKSGISRMPYMYITFKSSHLDYTCVFL